VSLTFEHEFVNSSVTYLSELFKEAEVQGPSVR